MSIEETINNITKGLTESIEILADVDFQRKSWLEDNSVSSFEVEFDILLNDYLTKALILDDWQYTGWSNEIKLYLLELYIMMQEIYRNYSYRDSDNEINDELLIKSNDWYQIIQKARDILILLRVKNK